VRLSGKEVSTGIAAKLTTSPPALHVALLEILAARRALDALPQMLESATADDAVVRMAAM